MDEKTQIQALGGTQPVLPIAFDASEKRTHDYVRHGTMNLRGLPGFSEKRRQAARGQGRPCGAGQPLHPHHAGGGSSAGKNPQVTIYFTPVGSSWSNQIENWFSIITRQAIRRGTFSSVKILIRQIRDSIQHWNSVPKPFAWTATADEILAKVRLVQTNIKKLVDNNGK
jgi:hypothetical protein